MSYRTIVFGTDGSDTAAVAQAAAFGLASRADAEVVIVSAFGGTLARDAAEAAVAAAASLAEQRGVKVRTLVVEAPAAEAILHVASTEDAGAIVVGSRGMGPARRLHLGDVPDRVAHGAPCDVLIVDTSDERKPAPIRTMLVGTDGSPTATEATRKAFELAEILRAAVTVIYVGDPMVGAIVLEQAIKDRPGEARAETLLEQGDPADRIREAAARTGVDLIVVGNKGMAGARRFLGSVPDRVAHEAPTDVLIVKTVGRALEDLAPGHGGIVTIGSRTVAGYRDEQGVLHAVSPRCTHMGCTVDWNDREKTWDCPCHGSRYRWDGAVTHGPAKRDLAPEDVSES